MTRKIAAIGVGLLVVAGITVAKAQSPAGDESKRLRDEIRRVEAQLAELTAQLESLKTRLAKAEGVPPAHPPALRFPVGIERAMLRDGIYPKVAPQWDGGRFDPQPKQPPPMQQRSQN